MPLLFPSVIYSIADVFGLANRRSAGMPRWRSSIFLVFLLLQSPVLLALPDVRISAEHVVHEYFELTRAQASFKADGSFVLDAKQLGLPSLKREWADFSLTGQLEELANEKENLNVRSTIRVDDLNLLIELSSDPEKMFASVVMAPVEVIRYAGLAELPPEAEWLSRGQLATTLTFTQAAGEEAVLAVKLSARDISFDSPDGLFAAEALHIDVEITAPDQDWAAPGISCEIRSGELLLQDFYLDFSDGSLECLLKPSLRKERLEHLSFMLTDRSFLLAEGRAVFAENMPSPGWAVEISRLDLEFPGAYQRYMEPVLAPLTLNGLEATGRISWSGDWSAGAFASGDLRITDLSIVDTQRSRFALTGLDARMRPGDHSFNSSLDWRGLLLGRLNLGPGSVSLDSEPGRVAITQPLVLQVLGGTLNLEELKVLLPGASGNDADEPDIRLRASLNDLDMEQLTAAMGWPSFEGTISGRVPGVSLDDGVLDVDGEILIDVFDGQVALKDLRVERPFGVLPSLAANIEANNLDLELLTSTFSFGQISGRVDGYVRDLRMLDWKPVAFDAWFGTPEGQKGARDISRQAVNRLTTLGGGSATTALASPVMRLFSKFSYKRLGLGCLMQNNTCQIRGVSEDDVSVLIMEGAGIPKVTIRAFNRMVDWPRLLAQLAAASDGETIRVGDKSQ